MSPLPLNLLMNHLLLMFVRVVMILFICPIEKFLCWLADATSAEFLVGIIDIQRSIIIQNQILGHFVLQVMVGAIRKLDNQLIASL